MPDALTAARPTTPTASPPPGAPDPRQCPLCGQSNLCAEVLARSTGLPPAPCWCATQTIPAATLARIPLSARDRACVCARCAAQPL